MPQRNIVIDLMKGLGIVLVILAHTKFPFTHFIYLFHMPLFFLASGYLFKVSFSDSVQSLSNLVRRRIFSLYLPCLGWNLSFLLLHNLLFQLHLEKQLLPGTMAGGLPTWLPPVLSFDFWVLVAQTACLFMYSEPLAGVTWFFRALFLAGIGYAGIYYLARRACPHFQFVIVLAVCLFCLFFNFYLGSTLHIPGTRAAFSCLIFFPLGALLRQIPLSPGRAPVLIPLGVSLSAACLLLFLEPYGFVALNRNAYTNPFFLIASAIGGWYLLWGISVLCSRSRKLTSWLCYAARHSIPILFLHFLCFKASALLWIGYSGEPLSSLSLFQPESGNWWPVSFCAGLLLPVALLKGWSALKLALFKLRPTASTQQTATYDQPLR